MIRGSLPDVRKSHSFEPQTYSKTKAKSGGEAFLPGVVVAMDRKGYFLHIGDKRVREKGLVRHSVGQNSLMMKGGVAEQRTILVRSTRKQNVSNYEVRRPLPKEWSCS